VVRQDLDLYGHRTAALRDLYADPAAGLARLSREITTFWLAALAPEWPRIQLLLDAEVFARARQLAEDGAGGLLNDLHEQVRWAGGTLTVDKRSCAAGDVPDGTGRPPARPQHPQRADGAGRGAAQLGSVTKSMSRSIALISGVSTSL
jgi:hypothetical protein